VRGYLGDAEESRMKDEARLAQAAIAAGALAFVATRPPVARQLLKGFRLTVAGTEAAFSALAQWKFIMDVIAPKQAAPARLLPRPADKPTLPRRQRR
jgi:hypothetical protein